MLNTALDSNLSDMVDISKEITILNGASVDTAIYRNKKVVITILIPANFGTTGKEIFRISNRKYIPISSKAIGFLYRSGNHLSGIASALYDNSYGYLDCVAYPSENIAIEQYVYLEYEVV